MKVKLFPDMRLSEIDLVGQLSYSYFILSILLG